ncbi:MAG: hypothetical protein RBU27_10545 [Bacteroidota bacterium]|jgi:hypothetical protein|nr:hypothetical protein [Bacteroidota bacterium]
MNISRHFFLSTIAVIVVLHAVPDHAEAQNPFRLKRTKQESVPITVTLLAGYNGMSDPAEPYQDSFENTNLTSLGGLGVGLQGMIDLDTLLVRIRIGAEVTYFRMFRRALYDDRGVHFVGEEWSTEHPVDAIESLWGIGANALVAFGPVWNLSIILGAGLEYHAPRIDKDLPITGTLTEPRVIPAAMAAVNLILLEYDHGSIDMQIRGTKGFGDHGNVQLQSLLGFTFIF